MAATMRSARGRLVAAPQHIELRLTGLRNLSRQEIWECLTDLSTKVRTTLLESKTKVAVLLDRDQLRHHSQELIKAVEQLRDRIRMYDVREDIKSRSAMMLEAIKTDYLRRRELYLQEHSVKLQ